MRLVAWFTAMVLVGTLNGCGSGSGDSGTNIAAQTGNGGSFASENGSTVTTGPGTASPANTQEGTATATPTTNTPSSDTSAPISTETINPTTVPDTTASTATMPNTVPTAPAPAQTTTTTTEPTSANPAPASSSTGSAMQAAMVAAINKARLSGMTCGTTYYGPTTAITWNDQIGSAASRHSNDMAARDFFSHTGSDGSSAGDRLTQAGYIWSTYGENIAVGYSTPAAVVQAWLNSEGHCRNIMNPAYLEIGAGAATGTYRGVPAMDYWTLDLGKKR
ncbi:SCP-like domain protein [Geotalea daltonii FRC-32]|uniref:SCP-like domain protein n=1 Tax=Geotalea daltonii (strain DSM 22248 / JCM 15807 / FRC-32) TaxID=316067 RepID=B9M4A7_GEODF|nr:CAP domain-containing protein [Geotalea daltonii]ACM21562.1 SCP-like domain protein [Geotalea daltonii FRC-32]